MTAKERVMDEIDITILTWKQLKQLGYPFSPTHTVRLMKKGTFPRCFKLQNDPKARKVWWLREYKAWLLERAKSRNGSAE